MSTGCDRAEKINVAKPPPALIFKVMSTKRVASRASFPRDERGDPSEKALKVTIVVCLVGLVVLYLFAFSPRKASQPGTAATATPPPQAKEAVATFDRQSLSTKNR